VPLATPLRSRAPIDVFRYQDYRAFLAAFYALKKSSGLSYRRFSATVGLGAPNYLKLVIDGKRNLSPAMAQRFADACKLQGESSEYFCLLVQFNQSQTDEERNSRREQLVRFARYRQAQAVEVAQADYHSTWYIPVVRELVACPRFVGDSAWVARALRPEISEKQAERALEVLERLGFLERDAAGNYCQTSRAVSTGDQASGLHIRNYHAEMMKRATAAMETVPASEREISSLTLSVSPELLEEVARRVKELRDELVRLCDAEPSPSKVVQLNLQLFPVSYDLTNLNSPTDARPDSAKTKRK
jgi:uncharacterized protein (TIGR02147 family)